MNALRQFTHLTSEHIVLGSEADKSTKKDINAQHGVEHRRFGQLNISITHAKELSENLKFIEECIQEGFTGLALEVAEELNTAFKKSPSLLVKILLRELTDYLKSPNKKSRQTLTLNTLNMMILTRCQMLD